MRIVTFILLLTASTRALVSPYFIEARIAALCRFIFFLSSTNSFILHRCAHFIQASNSITASVGMLENQPQLFFEKICSVQFFVRLNNQFHGSALVLCQIFRVLQQSVLKILGVLFFLAGSASSTSFFANRMAAFRTSSRLSVAQPTTWNGSTQRSALGQ